MTKNKEVVVEYYENGKKESEYTEFEDGRKVETCWFEDGKKESEYTEFEDGSYVETCWFEDGNIGKEETCKVGKGFHETIYFVNGKKYNEKDFKEDGSGVETYYYEDGTKRCEGHSNKKGDIFRVSQWWSKDGKTKHQHYKGVVNGYFVRTSNPDGFGYLNENTYW